MKIVRLQLTSYIEIPTLYFKEGGEACTRRTLEYVSKYVKENDIEHVVIPSTKGHSAKMALGEDYKASLVQRNIRIVDRYHKGMRYNLQLYDYPDFVTKYRSLDSILKDALCLLLVFDLTHN